MILLATSTIAMASSFYSVTSGVLPAGMYVSQSGVLMGTPQVMGTFTFSISNGLTGDEHKESQYQIKVEELEDDSCTYVVYELGDDTSVLTPGMDTSPEPMTSVSIKQSTFFLSSVSLTALDLVYMTKVEPENAHSITGNQNFSEKERLGKQAAVTGSDSAKKTTSQYSSGKQALPSFQFKDVKKEDWFYEDVKWANSKGYMSGESSTKFSPQSDISQATVVTVLSRVADVNLDYFNKSEYKLIPQGKWYTAPATWAMQTGMLPDYTKFTGEAVISRETMAVMLVKYLRSMGVDCSAPESPAYFADANKMTKAGYDAFQILYKNGIFKGTGNNIMDPAGTTTRAQFSALINRVSSCIGG